MNQKRSLPTLTLSPIGHIKTAMRLKFDAPHQPSDPDAQEGVVELIGGHNFEAALEDLAGFDRIWLLWWFDKNKTWNPKVLPPRGAKQKRGVFATRSPHRPNPLGITAVALKGIKGRRIAIGPCDLIDGTPILDIKPYVPLVDAFPEAKIGWLGSVEDALIEAPRFEVLLSELAREQISWLELKQNITFYSRAKGILERDPTPHRTRRIVLMPSGEYRMSCGAWRLFYVLSGHQVTIVRVASGYPEKSIMSPAKLDRTIPDQSAQVAFLVMWPSVTEDR